MKALVYKVLYPFAICYWFLVRPKTQGVKAVIFFNYKVLLIKNTYASNNWTLPGGGIKDGETPDGAIRREVKEEVGIISDFDPLGSFESTAEYKRDTIHCFVGHADSPSLVLQKDELLKAKWFPLDSLPEDRSQHVDFIFNLYNHRYEK